MVADPTQHAQAGLARLLPVCIALRIDMVGELRQLDIATELRDLTSPLGNYLEALKGDRETGGRQHDHI